MPKLQFDQQSASSLLNPTFTLSYSTCLFHVLFILRFFLLPTSSKSHTHHKTWPSSLLNTWPYQRTLFSIANWSIVSFKPNITIKSLLFSIYELYATNYSHHGSLCPSKNSQLSFWCHASLPCRIDGLHSSHKQPLSALEEISLQRLTKIQKLSPPTSCFGGHSSFTSSTCNHVTNQDM